MKKLLILRHGKSNWSFDLPDHDRPLNDRGKRNVLEVAQRFKSQNIRPDYCFHSTAKRATDTAKPIAKALSIEAQSVKELYTFDAEDVLRFLMDVDDSYEFIMLVGHNPAYTDLVNMLTIHRLDNLPTAGYALMSFETNTWKSIAKITGKLEMLEYPKLF